MSSDELSRTWHDAMTEVLANCRAKLSALEIPTIEGTIRGSGHTFICCDFSFLETHEALLRQQNCLGVIDVGYSEDEKGERQIRALSVHVRLGTSNSWLTADVSLPSLGEEDDDDHAQEMEQEVESSVLTAVALATARTPQFGLLKNKGQRQEFALSILKKKEFKDVPSYYASEIAQRAEGIYEFGVLPEKVRNLSSQGKTVTEISKELGLTKQKVERALTAETPEFIADMMKSTPQSS